MPTMLAGRARRLQRAPLRVWRRFSGYFLWPPASLLVRSHCAHGNGHRRGTTNQKAGIAGCIWFRPFWWTVVQICSHSLSSGWWNFYMAASLTVDAWPRPRLAKYELLQHPLYYIAYAVPRGCLVHVIMVHMYIASIYEKMSRSVHLPASQKENDIRL